MARYESNTGPHLPTSLRILAVGLLSAATFAMIHPSVDPEQLLHNAKGLIIIDPHFGQPVNPASTPRPFKAEPAQDRQGRDMPPIIRDGFSLFSTEKPLTDTTHLQGLEVQGPLYVTNRPENTLHTETGDYGVWVAAINDKGETVGYISRNYATFSSK